MYAWEIWNQALDVLEQNIANGKSWEGAARTACCSTYHFQRMFSYLAGLPLSEYIRRRKMTLAAFDLLEKGEKVIDVALKYGYQSPTAFTRAFQSVHGISPSEAKQTGAILKAFPPIRFQITIQGVFPMNYRIEQKPELHILGIDTPLQQIIEQNFQTIPQFWKTVSQNGFLSTLLSQKATNQPVLGISDCRGENWRYWIGIFSEQDAAPPMSSFTLPPTTWAVFDGQGAMPETIQALEKRIFTEWLPSSGYQYGNGVDIEVYHNADPANAIFEVWIPVVPKQP